MTINDPLYLYEEARRKARLAAAKHISDHLSVTLPPSVLGTAVDIAISIYNAEIGDAAEKALDLGKPSDIEVIAERLAKVEDRLAHTPSIDAVTRELNDSAGRLDDRITEVADIIGERVSGLVDRLDKLEGPAGWLDNMQASINGLTERLDGPQNAIDALVGSIPIGLRAGFPTGGATTAEAAAEAVLPVPQRGDRVLIRKGAQTLGGAVLKEQWATVIGLSKNLTPLVQVELDGDGDTRSIPWIDVSFIMEVRHADR